MTNTFSNPEKLKRYLEKEAHDLGFELCRITTPDAIPDAPKHLARYLEEGRHASMTWMNDTFERRSNPRALWPDTCSIIMLGMNYGPDHDPLAVHGHTEKGAISVYAQNRDYHDVIKGKLKILAGKLAARSRCEVKVFVDTAPVMEKPLAQAAGMGWQGKHSNLVSPELGSWFFIGSIFTTAQLPSDKTEPDHCGSCRACLDACPTDAFPSPYQVDARRCISWLTIENKGPIPREFRKALGNRIYGCDDCLAVCPWNKFARLASEAKLVAREDLKAPSLAKLSQLDDAAFRAFFSANPVKRIGRDRFMRNVLVAIGNSSQANLVDCILPHLEDINPLVRGAAIWALSQLDRAKALELAKSARAGEKDASVLEEWRQVS